MYRIQSNQSTNLWDQARYWGDDKAYQAGFRVALQNYPGYDWLLAPGMASEYPRSGSFRRNTRKADRQPIINWTIEMKPT